MHSPDIPFSTAATTRWKRNFLNSLGSKYSIADDKNLRRLVNTQDASKFINNSFTPGFATPKISRNEDLREVSLQLVTLKKKHDFNKSLNYRNQRILDKDLKFIENIRSVESKTVATAEELGKKLEEKQKLYEEIKQKQEEALAARKVYKHMLNRMKITKINFDKQNLDFTSKLKINEIMVNEEQFRSRKAKESKNHARTALSSLSDYISLETKEKHTKLSIIKKDADQQLKNTQNRELRMKRQVEIAEAAADDDRNMRAMQIREGVMVHRLWYFSLEIKLQEIQKRFAVIDNAFRRVKNQYGFIDESEMIEKMLTKEQTYSQLLSSISYNKAKIIEQTEKIKDLNEKIEVLTSLKAQNLDPNKFWKDHLQKTIKETSAEKKRLMKIRTIYDKIRVWIDRVLEKLGAEQDFKYRKLKDYFQNIRVNIGKAMGKSSKIKVFDNKARVDKMKIEQVLMYYVGDEAKKRKSSRNLAMIDEVAMGDLPIVDNDENKEKDKLSK